MAFTQFELTAMAQKYQLGILSTAGIAPAIKYYYNENFPQYAALPGGKVYIDAIPGAKTYPDAVANASLYPAILEQKKVRLTLDITSNDRAYEARQTFGDRTTPTIEDWIYPQFVQIDGGASAGYGIALYHGDPDLGGVKVAETFGQTVDMVGWMFSYSMGVIVCSTAEAPQFLTWYNTNGLYIRGFRYIGTKGGGGTTTSTGLFTSCGFKYFFQVETFIADSTISSTGQVTITVDPELNSVFVYQNNICLSPEEYNVVGKVVTITGQVVNIGDSIDVKYMTKIPLYTSTGIKDFIKTTFSFASFPALELLVGKLPFSYVHRAVIKIVTAFNTSCGISIGTDTDPNKFFNPSFNDPLSPARYVEEPDAELLATTEVKLFFAGTPTAGTGEAIVYYA